MKKLALISALFVTVHLLASCTPRPEETDEVLEGTGMRDTGIEQSDFVPVAKPHADPGREHYILSVDTSSLSRDLVGDPTGVRVRVTGPLGDGCQRYEYMDSVGRGKTLYMVFWASRPKDPNAMCTQQMQYYNTEIRVDRALYTRFSIVLPDGRETFFQVAD